MSKGLEEIKTLRTFNQREVGNDKNVNNSLDTIEKELKRLEAIDNSNPSEAMESLERIDKEYATIENEDFKICFNTIKQALLKAQKMERVLEIIFEKNVTIFWLKECKNLEEYNYNTAYHMKLTQEEFNLLKEVLECQKD